MQAAVDIIDQSQHPTSKVAATLAGTATDGTYWVISKTNIWPQKIEHTIGKNTKIGNASGTIHAETDCLIEASKQGLATQDADIFVSDPPCPNCVKNIAEAGIKAMYIDHKGFDKDWATRRGDSFDQMSMRIAEKAGIDVYKIFRKEQRVEGISEHSSTYSPPNEDPAKIVEYSKTSLQNMLRQSDDIFAIGIAKNTDHKAFLIQTLRHPTIGYTSKTIEPKDGKYSFILQPVNRLLMTAAKKGLSLERIITSRTPTSRELVNLAGTNISNLHIINPNKARDEHGLAALSQIQAHKILPITTGKDAPEY